MQGCLGRLERGRLLERSWIVQDGLNEGAAGHPWSPLQKDDGEETRYKYVQWPEDDDNWPTLWANVPFGKERSHVQLPKFESSRT